MMICHNYDIACVRTCIQYYLAVFCSPAIQLYCYRWSVVIKAVWSGLGKKISIINNPRFHRGKLRSWVRDVGGRGTPGHFRCYGDTSCCWGSLFGVHRPFINTAYDIAIVHSACSFMREKTTPRERTIHNLAGLSSSHDPARSSEFIYPGIHLSTTCLPHTLQFI